MLARTRFVPFPGIAKFGYDLVPGAATLVGGNFGKERGSGHDQRHMAMPTMPGAQATFRSLIGLLNTIPGISTLSATTILAETDTDMSRFATAGHFVAWAGLCPGQNESAGKRKSSRLRKGAPWLKAMLVQCAWAAVKKKDSYYKAQFNRLCNRRGPKKAICAVAAAMLTAIYHMLKNGVEHRDLGIDHFDRRSTEIRTKRLVAQLTNLGFQVELQPLEQAA